MREKPRDSSRLRHILHAIVKVEEFIEGKTSEDMQFDSLLYYGVVKNIEIIGEASYMLTEEFKEKHPSTPWRQIIGMRHYMVHGYYCVDKNEVWIAATRDLPKLKGQIIDYLREVDNNTHQSD